MPIKIVFSWSTISGYMAVCWRELAKQTNVELFVVAHRSGGTTAFGDKLMEGIPHRLLDADEKLDCALVESIVAQQRPDVVAMTGWWLPTNRALAASAQLSDVKFIMGVDTPWRHEAQFLTRFRYWTYFKQIDHVFVTGERSWQYVRRLGFPPARISRGMYGVDVARWSQLVTQREAQHWPRIFLFLGRYTEVKALDVLIAAYQKYRVQVENPWMLTCCGKGDDAKKLEGVEGVIDRGFVQPEDLDAVFLQSGALVMPSRFDPWPLALVEAAAAGLPIICSDACGSAVENVRDGFNGYVLPTGDVDALAGAMLRLHEQGDILKEWGRCSNQFAQAYSTEMWVGRWTIVAERFFGKPQTSLK